MHPSYISLPNPTGISSVKRRIVQHYPESQRPTSLSPPLQAPRKLVLGTGRDDHLDVVARRTIDERGVVALVILLPDPWGSIARPAVGYCGGVELVYLLTVYFDSAGRLSHSL
jgi:hypothetical protein